MSTIQIKCFCISCMTTKTNEDGLYDHTRQRLQLFASEEMDRFHVKVLCMTTASEIAANPALQEAMRKCQIVPSAANAAKDP